MSTLEVVRLLKQSFTKLLICEMISILKAIPVLLMGCCRIKQENVNFIFFISLVNHILLSCSMSVHLTVHFWELYLHVCTCAGIYLSIPFPRLYIFFSSSTSFSITFFHDDNYFFIVSLRLELTNGNFFLANASAS